MVILTGRDKGIFDRILQEITDLRESHQQSRRDYEQLKTRNVHLAAALESAQQIRGRLEFQAKTHREKTLKKLGAAWAKKVGKQRHGAW